MKTNHRLNNHKKEIGMVESILLKMYLTLLIVITVQSNLISSSLYHNNTSFANQTTLYSFENGIPKNFHFKGGSRGNTSEKKYLYGQKSLEWKWTAGSSFSIKEPYKVYRETTVPLLKKIPGTSHFIFWVYSDHPHPNAKLKIEFSNDKQHKCFFYLKLNFKGWRTAWPRFKDMEGTFSQDMNLVRFIAPSNIKEGTLFIDGIRTSLIMDKRLSRDDSHHSTRYKEKYISIEEHLKKISNNHKIDINKKDYDSICTRIEIDLIRGSLNQKRLTSIDKKYKNYQIEIKDGSVHGKHIPLHAHKVAFHSDHPEIFKEYSKYNLRALGKLCREIATCYKLSQEATVQQRLETYFINIVRHLIDQGWTEGHIHGAAPHYGYNSREMIQAIFLMRNELKKISLLAPITKSLLYYLNFFNKSNLNYANMDFLNTESHSTLMTLLMIDKKEYRDNCITSYIQKLSYALYNKENNHNGGFKIDNSAYHHQGHYPGYFMGAIDQASQIINWLKDTSAAINSKGITSIVNILLASENYTNGGDVPRAICGRHPFKTNCDFKYAYLKMLDALPSDTINFKKLANSYIRRFGNPQSKNLKERFKQQKISKTKIEGHWVMPYAGLSTHRRNNWMVSVRGFSKYIWNSEIYVPCNRFGRYQSYGAIEIYNNEGRLKSGYDQEGWDWSHNPGTTAIALPHELLVPPSTVYMAYNSETFVGGVQHRKNGAYAINLVEDMFDNKMIAQKSFHFYDNMIYCLGTGISSTNISYPVHTTLFQSRSKQKPEHNLLNKAFQNNNLTTTSKNSSNILSDTYGNHYIIMPNQKVTYSLKKQTSEDVAALKITEGTFHKAYLEHGITPQDAKYQYIIATQSTIKEAQSLEKSLFTNSPHFRVLRHDRQIHCVERSLDNIRSYAIFDPSSVIDDDIIFSVNTAVMLMLSNKKEDYLLSVSDPDMKMQPGERFTLPNEYYLKKPSPKTYTDVSISLNGHYKSQSKNTDTIYHPHLNKTTLTLRCKYGQTQEVSLKKQKSLP